MGTHIKISECGRFATVTKKIEQGLSQVVEVVRVAYNGDKGGSIFVHNRVLFINAGQSKGLYVLLKQVDKMPVTGHGHKSDAAWQPQGGADKDKFRDTAPGGAFAHVASAEGLLKCAHFFKDGFFDDGYHLNIVLLRYLLEQGHFQDMHKDHPLTNHEQLRCLRASVKFSGNKRLVIRVQGPRTESIFLLQDSSDKTKKKMIAYVLPPDVITVIDADGDLLDLDDHGHGGVVHGEDNYTIMVEVIGTTCGDRCEAGGCGGGRTCKTASLDGAYGYAQTT